VSIASLPVSGVHSALQTRREGLDPVEVDERLRELGPNVLHAPTTFSWPASLLRQFTNFFTILLDVSAAICFVANALRPGEGMNVLGFALFGVSALNALFSFVQEYRAEKAMEALRRFLPHRVTVRRSGREQTVLADGLVPGDVLLLVEGDRVPADARIVEQHLLLANNAPLTGESRPVPLGSEPFEGRLLDAPNVAFAGCQVLRGTAEAIVFATGSRTEFGKISTLSSDTSRKVSPLQQETNHMVRVLTRIAVGMGFVFFVYGLLTGRPLIVNLIFMMGIIVANVPEGLLPTFTLSLAMGSLRMARRNVLVNGLTAVEAIGAVHVVCTDKTGTLTQNRLSIARVLSPRGDVLSGEGRRRVLEAALVSSDVHEKDGRLAGDPLDVAVAEAWLEEGGRVDGVVGTIVEPFPFDVASRRAGAVAARREGGRWFAVKGAWEALAELSTSLREGDAEAPLTGTRRREIDDCIRKLAAGGSRVIAVAQRPIDPREPPTQVACERDLVVEGLLCLEDPLRAEVPAAVAQCRQAGIDVVLITGDHPETARAVAVEAGIVSADIDSRRVTAIGEELEDATIEAVARRIDRGVRIFARSTPKQKMTIVRALQRRQKIVAMTGDGVNDAPSLKAADVGIAMGASGTDVARESAQIVLLDDNFASIVAGIEEGRTVFANIKKFTNYVLVSNGPEILPYLLFILLPVPLALTVIQILSIDLGTDIIPSIALGQEPPDPDAMRRPPRSEREELLSLPILAHSYLFLGLIEAAWSLALFFLVLTLGGWSYGDPVMSAGDPLYQRATGISLSTILLMQIGNLIGRRHRDRSGLDPGLFGNRLLLAGILVQVVFSWATLYTPALNRVLGTQPVEAWIYACAWLGVPLIFLSDLARTRLATRLRRRGVRSPWLTD
jgi:sodium/potassium-transporting ATPase subunit alpha